MFEQAILHLLEVDLQKQVSELFSCSSNVGLLFELLSGRRITNRLEDIEVQALLLFTHSLT